MAFYAAYLPPQKSGQSEADRLAEAALLRDGFSLSAFLFTGLWLLVKRLWLPLLAFAVIYGLIVLAQMRYGFHPAAAAVAQLVIGGWLGLEAASLAGRRLIAKGWRLADVIEARSQEEAERRFFERALAASLQPVPPHRFLRLTRCPRRPAAAHERQRRAERRHRRLPRGERAMSVVAIIDYGSGNLHSAAKAFERAAREAGLAASITVTADPEAVRRADRIVLPGVGAFADCRKGLDAVPGMVEAITEAAKARPGLSLAFALACNCWRRAGLNTP